MSNRTKSVVILLFFICIVFRFQIGDFCLSNFGCKSNAIVIADKRYSRYQKPTLYQFSIDGNHYYGNSMLTDSSEIGSTVCVIYLPILPSVNRLADFLGKDCN
jgi:hypothetical protein